MGATYHYLEAPNGCEVLNWFRGQPEKPRELPKPEAVLLHYSEAGETALNERGEVEVSNSPLISLIPPSHASCARAGHLGNDADGFRRR